MTTSSKLSDEQVRTLLNSTETNRVDYKRKMGFNNGTDQQKANLLKDVLAWPLLIVRNPVQHGSASLRLIYLFLKRNSLSKQYQIAHAMEAGRHS